jgi:hypothetical protein
LRPGNSEAPGSNRPRCRPPPPGAQQLEHLRRQHEVAVFAALTLFDPQEHALGVDLADLERDDLGNAQPGTLGDGEFRLALRPRRCLEQQRDLLDAR